MEPIAATAALYLSLWFYKLTHVVPATWYDTHCSYLNGTLAKEGWSWRQHFAVLVVVASLKTLVLLPAMLVMVIPRVLHSASSMSHSFSGLLKT